MPACQARDTESVMALQKAYVPLYARHRARPVLLDDRRSCFSAISSSACSLEIGWNVPSGMRFIDVRIRSGWLCWSGRCRPLMHVYPP